MPEHDQFYPRATRELAEQRKHLAPAPAEAFRAGPAPALAGLRHVAMAQKRGGRKSPRLAARLR